MSPDLQPFFHMQIVLSSVWSSCSLQFHLDKTRVNIFTWVLHALVLSLSLSLSLFPPLFTLLHSSNPWKLLEIKTKLLGSVCISLFQGLNINKKYTIYKTIYLYNMVKSNFVFVMFFFLNQIYLKPVYIKSLNMYICVYLITAAGLHLLVQCRCH